MKKLLIIIITVLFFNTIKAQTEYTTPGCNVWSDNVFSKDYKLIGLPELEKYIHINKHQPEMPSEARVKDKGVNVADMQTKLLQKVEELTLLMIEQNKSIAALKKENVALKAQVEKIVSK